MAKQLSKRLSITIPDKMYKELQKLKVEMGGKEGKKKISEICQNALNEALAEAEAYRAYRKKGIEDGKRISSSILKAEKEYVSRVLGKDGPYEKWSTFEKIEELLEYFSEIKKLDYRDFLPKFSQIMDGELLLHDWVKVKDEQIKDDRLGEVAWFYNAGCFEGINEEYTKNKNRKK